MRTIKILVITLFVALGGVAYATSSAQEATHKGHSSAKSACCKAHAPDAQQEAAPSCDMKSGKGCCAGAGGSCCAAHQSKSARATTVAAQDAKKEGAGCACCVGHKPAGAKDATATSGDEAKTGCCGGGDCCKDCRRHEGGADTKAAAVAQGGAGHSCCASCGSCCQAQVARQ
jgi:hypothetical protein